MRGADVKPRDLVARAFRLSAADQVQAAIRLLIDRRGDFPRVPPTYDAAIARLYVLAGDYAAAVDYQARGKATKIARAKRPRKAAAAPDVATKRLRVGTALFEAGRAVEAGPHLSAAAAQGAEIMRLHIGIAIDAHRRAHGNKVGYDTSLGPTFTLVNTEKKLAYVSIKKNACTLLKANFILNSPYRDAFLASKLAIHGYCDALRPPVPRAVYMGEDYFRFVVLRDPFRRLVSVYLNKIVRNRLDHYGQPALHRYLTIAQMAHTIREAQRDVGIDYDPVRSITFEEFIRFLARAHDYECNEHWTPQVRFVGTDLGVYQHVGKLEKLQGTLDLLSGRFGFSLREAEENKALGGQRHKTQYAEVSALPAPYAALPRDLDAFEDRAPHPDSFYTAELRTIVEQRFAADFRLYNAA